MTTVRDALEAEGFSPVFVTSHLRESEYLGAVGNAGWYWYDVSCVVGLRILSTWHAVRTLLTEMNETAGGDVCAVHMYRAFFHYCDVLAHG